MGYYDDVTADTLFQDRETISDDAINKWRKEVLPLELLLLIARTNQYCDYNVITLTGSTPYDLEITIDDAFLIGEDVRTYYYKTITPEQFQFISVKVNSILLDVKSRVVKDKLFRSLSAFTPDELELLKDIDVVPLIKEKINRFTE